MVREATLMIKVLIVDDSALVRTTLQSILEKAVDIQVVGTAADPYFARDKIKKLNPDVITLDVEMPRMDGLTFLEKLMAYRPMPVIMISSLTQQGAETTLKALSLGAVDYVAKPTGNLEHNLSKLSQEIVEKVRIAARARVRTPVKGRKLEVDDKVRIDQVLKAAPSTATRGSEELICIGASTGGTTAIEQILQVLPGDTAGIVVVQHMPPGYTKSFADRLNGMSALEVLEAEAGLNVGAGRAIIARGGNHLLLQRRANGYYVDVKDGPPVNRHKPSVDVLFRSAANAAGRNALGIILTGMGDDGAKGLQDLMNVGAFTVAQNEATSVVFGMPAVAIQMGAARRVSPLQEIPSVILSHMMHYRPSRLPRSANAR